ncbi:hypothetical protein EYZ11_012399 [Aspergillus tanneri]|uniref:Uncharacterized protein n=1 Tax=Aspergillus tanneri TaxID=1220188 RepID=A0A4S3J0C2_9EURO|nr:hypothetical protein EYZ11_012399 [Aspergillus tanneri]
MPLHGFISKAGVFLIYLWFLYNENIRLRERYVDLDSIALL